MTDKSQIADLNTTISTLQQEFTSIPVADAVALIESWQQQLQGTGFVEDLGHLKSALTTGDSPSSLADLLTNLGKDTAASAAGTNGEVAAKVQQLAELLSGLGKALT